MGNLIYSTKDVFTSYLKGRKFNIPEYQRGYKWSNQQIEQLLNDISEFDDKNDDDLFYCLQNITTYPSKTEYNILNVVDGQQRLTTTFLLYCYLGNENLLSDKINYAVRESSNSFIQKIQRERSQFIENVLMTKDFDDFCQFSKDLDYDHQDIFYMFSAIRTFDKWFLNQNVSKELFFDKFSNKVKFIVNEISADIKEQELFMNLNTGKVPLDGADLVRAIIITRVAKEEMGNVDLESVKDIVRLNEKRTRIGWEIDQLNQWWMTDEVRKYYKPFIRIENDSQEAIIFDYDINPINVLYSLWAEKQLTKEGKDLKLGLKIFEQSTISALKLYNELMFLHRTLQDWFLDREIYHYLGFLSHHKKEFRFAEFYKFWLVKDQTKEEFLKELKKEIKRNVFGLKKNQIDDENIINKLRESILNYEGVNKADWYNGKEGESLEKILILMDVIEISGNDKISFLSPSHFKKFNEDKEHIYPCTPKNIRELNSENDISSLRSYLRNLNIEEILPYSDKQWKKFTEFEKAEKLKIIEDKIHTLTPINSIGNLVLLHYSINRGFGNDYYIDKRVSVVENVKNGEYIRQHTLNVFINGRSESKDLNNWSFRDIKKNADFIEENIKNFFNLRELPNEESAA